MHRTQTSNASLHVAASLTFPFLSSEFTSLSTGCCTFARRRERPDNPLVISAPLLLDMNTAPYRASDFSFCHDVSRERLCMAFVAHRNMMPGERDSHKAVPIAVTPHRLFASEVPLELSLPKPSATIWLTDSLEAIEADNTRQEFTTLCRMS